MSINNDTYYYVYGIGDNGVCCVNGRDTYQDANRLAAELAWSCGESLVEVWFKSERFKTVRYLKREYRNDVECLFRFN